MSFVFSFNCFVRPVTFMLGNMSPEKIPWITVGVIQFYVIMIPGLLYISFWHRSFPNSAELLMPAISSHAVKFWPMYSTASLVLVLIGLLSRSKWNNFICSISLIVTWIWYFMICYDGFLGDMSLHHESSFDAVRFLSFCYGLFPITLIAMLMTVVSFVPRRIA